MDQRTGKRMSRRADRLQILRKAASRTTEVLESRQLLAADVIVTEIMHHPIPYDLGAEYIELYNRGSTPVDLAGWSIARGVDFTFEARTLGAKQYLVVAGDLASFSAKYPNVTNAVGGWDGRLSNSHETIEVRDATGAVVDSVDYADEGDWAVRRRGPLDHGHRGWTWIQDADGLGKSLELINLNLTNNEGQNWASSIADNGTPGQPNSVAATNIAPMIVDLTQTPIIPRSTDSVTITARIIDELGTAQSARLYYRVDAATPDSFTSIAMHDDGLNGDARANDGTWSAVLPPQANRKIVEFYLSATDGTKTRTWPAPTDDQGTQGANLLYQVDDTVYTGTQPIYRFVMTEAERAELADIGNGGPSSDQLSDAMMNGTFVSSDGVDTQVRYLVGFRNRGHGSRMGPPNNFHVAFASDHPWHGATAFNFNARYTHSQVIGSAIYRLAGLDAAETLPVQVRVNGTNLASGVANMFGSYAMLESIGSDFADNHFPDDGAGNLYNAFRVDPGGTPEADLRYEGTNFDTYRNRYFKETNSEEDDFSDLIRLVDALNNAPDATYYQEVSKVLNVEQWVRYLALDALLLNRETGLDRGVGDDYSLYRGFKDPRFVLIPHDLDTLMNQGNNTASVDTTIWNFTGVDGLNRFLNHPSIAPLFYQAFMDLMNTIWKPEVLNPLIDQVLGGWVATTNINAMKQFVVDRAAAVLRQIPQQFQITSTLPTQDGFLHTTSPAAVLSGTADVTRTRSVLVNGLPATWSARNGTWSLDAGTGAVIDTLIPADAVWKFLDTGVPADADWFTSAFDASTWKEGKAQLGFGDGDEQTPVNGGPSTSRYPTIYFRHQFEVSDPGSITALTLNILRDDGALVYLNDDPVPIVRTNMPADVDYNTLAIVNVLDPDEDRFYSYTIDPKKLKAGTNTIAVEVHQQFLTSADLSFALKLDAQRGTTTGGVPLNPGINRVQVQAFDGPNGTGNQVQGGFVDIWYEGPGSPPPPPRPQISNLSMIAPAAYRPGTPMLVQVAAIGPDGKPQRELWDATVSLSTDRSDVQLSSNQLTLHNGFGSILLNITGTAPFTLNAGLGNQQVSRSISSLAGAPMTTVSGTLSGTGLQWSGIVHVTGDVLVPDGQVLTIAPGTLVLMDGVASGDTGTDIDVEGAIQSLGTADQPVTITAFDPTKPWGEIHHNNAEPSLYQYTILTRAGSSPRGGHSNTGPAIRPTNSKITFDHSALTDNIGKIAQANGSDLSFISTHFARSVMGPEIAGTALLLQDSFIYEMRNPDDADGIYIHDQAAGQQVRLVGGMIGFTNDDAIDTLRSTVTIEDMVIRDANDKGVSVYGGVVNINRSLVIDNALVPEDGSAASISAKETGTATATVNIDHTTVAGTGIGIQGRDKYGAPNVTIIYNVTNSIIRTPDAVQTDYNPADIHISYSDLTESWPGAGNITADPLFVSTAGHDFHLRPGSPAANAGDPAGPSDPDGSRTDMGRYANAIAGTPAAQTLAAQTIGGTLVFYPEQGPYHITGDITIPADATIYILPGTSVFFDPGVGFLFNGGRIVAEGTQYSQIRFTRTPSASGPWEGLQFTNSMQDNRISYAVIEYGGLTTNNGMVGLTGSNLLLDHVYFDHTDRRRIRTQNSSLVVRNSEFADIFAPNQAPTTDNLSEHIWGGGIPAGGQFILENNIFGTTKGHNDAIDLDTASRPGPIPQILNNLFKGGGDDALDLEMDAHIEGNIFMNYRKDSYNTATGDSNVISAGAGYHYVMVRNVFVNQDHVAQVKDDAFLTFENNTVIGSALAAIYFLRPSATSQPGRGASLDGNIFEDVQTLFANVTPGQTQITLNRSIVPPDSIGLGIGNSSEDPRIIDPAGGNYHLRAGSPAIGAGRLGIDMGAMVPQGAWLSGVPSAVTAKHSASISVAGAGIRQYKYSLDGGLWSSELEVTTPIQLTNLTDGSHTLSVVAKDSTGVWQTEPTLATWTIRPSLLRINEVLAANSIQPTDMIELFNDGPDALDLGGMSISDDPAHPKRFIFPAGTTIASGQYLVLYADSRTVPGQIHIGFALSASGESLALYNSGGDVVDSISFGLQLEDLSIGRLADGSWGLTQPTFGQANIAERTGDPSQIRINEWLTDGVDPFKDDFVEVYNPDTLPVRVDGLILTDKPGGTPIAVGSHRAAFPNLSFINAKGFAAMVADGNVESGADHVGFKLSPQIGMLGVLDAASHPLQILLYGPQRTGISEGFSPDGSSTRQFLAQPSPGLTNGGSAISNTPLRISELMYNAPGAGALPGDDFEYVELMNVGAEPLNLAGYKVSGGIDAVLGNVSLAPGARGVLVKNLTSFAQRYGSGIDILGTYTGSLDNGGEQIRLQDATSAIILDFAYSDAWARQTDGEGYSLIINNPDSAPSVWGMASNWKASNAILGTPGLPESGRAVDSIRINEVLSHSHATAPDWIELYNAGSEEVDLSGWYLSDSSGNLASFKIPSGASSILQPGQYLVLYQNDPDGFGSVFGLSELGETLYLSESISDGVLGSYRNSVKFGGADTGISFGRYVNSQGTVQYPPMSIPTPGSANSSPKVGPIVISELMYHPSGSAPEFIELKNITDQDVLLYDPLIPANTWRFTDGIDYVFPANSMVPANGVALVVPISPATFRSQYGIPDSVPIYGPYTNAALSNNGEKVSISKPGGPDLDGTIPWIIVDQVEYGTDLPWPTSADGQGPSLTRIDVASWGDDAGNWEAGPDGGTPGFAQSIVSQITIPASQVISYLKRDGDLLKIWGDESGTGTPIDSLPFSSLKSMNILGGTSSANRLILDLSGGDVLPAGLLKIDSGLVELELAGSTTLNLQGLLLGSLAKLDIGKNSLNIVNGDLTQVTTWLASARNATPRWSGVGLGTTSANADQGLAVNQVGSDVKVKFTWNGDLNLDGRVNADDYFYIDQGFLQKPSLPKYHDGDFNFDGKINADDYFLIDQAFLNQKGVVLSAPKPALATTTTKTATRVFARDRIRKMPRRAKHLLR